MVTANRLKERHAGALFVLVLVYTLNFVDRQIIGILAVPIKADLGLSDSQLGLMGGLAFALFYTALGIPVALLADRFSRTWIMTVALTVWSVMTALCGLTGSFWQLFLARMGVGIGEAGGVAPAYSLIADFFPPTHRARAISIYSFGIPIGSSLGIVSGGVIASLVDWRIAFIVVGLAGVLLAPVFRLTVAEPRRGQFDQAGQALHHARFSEVIAGLLHKRSFWLLSLGASFASMMGYGIFFWLPSFLVRSYGLSLLHASLYFGAVLLTGGLAGIWAGGWLGDRHGHRDHRQFARIPAWAFLATVPCYALVLLGGNLFVGFVVLLVPTALGLMWLGPVMSTLQHLVPVNRRATASAVFLFIINLLGIGLGTYLIGALSDGLAGRFGDESLRYSILAGTGFYVIAAALFFQASRWLKQDWEN